MKEIQQQRFKMCIAHGKARREREKLSVGKLQTVVYIVKDIDVAHTLFLHFLSLSHLTFPHFFFEKKLFLSHFFERRQFSQFTLIICIHAEEVETKGAAVGTTRDLLRIILRNRVKLYWSFVARRTHTHVHPRRRPLTTINELRPLQINLSP